MAGKNRFSLPLTDGTKIVFDVRPGASLREIKAEADKALDKKNAEDERAFYKKSADKWSSGVSGAVAGESRKAKAPVEVPPFKPAKSVLSFATPDTGSRYSMPPIKAPDLEADTSRELRQYLSVKPGEEENIDWGEWRDLTPGQAFHAGVGNIGTGYGKLVDLTNRGVNALFGTDIPLTAADNASQIFGGGIRGNPDVEAFVEAGTQGLIGSGIARGAAPFVPGKLGTFVTGALGAGSPVKEALASGVAGLTAKELADRGAPGWAQFVGGMGSGGLAYGGMHIATDPRTINALVDLAADNAGSVPLNAAGRRANMARRRSALASYGPPAELKPNFDPAMMAQAERMQAEGYTPKEILDATGMELNVPPIAPGIEAPGPRALTPEMTAPPNILEAPNAPIVELAPEETAPPEPRGRQPGLSRAFEGVTSYADALKVAQAGGHLRPDARGFVMGSPDILPADMDAWRARTYDRLLRGANRQGMGWYQGTRDAIEQISDTPEMASTHARVGAAYSPQASPIDETNFAGRHHLISVLTGQPAKVTTADRANASNRAYGEVDPNTGYTRLTPEDVNLGEKTGPYATSKDPTVPMGWSAPSDLWHGRALEYAPDEGQEAFDRAFQATEHAFIKGENVLALERAKKEGWLPKDATVANLQEVLWVAKRKEAFMEKEMAKYNTIDPKTGKRKRAAPPTEAEALKYATEDIPRALDRAQGILSREYTPGGGLGEFPMITSKDSPLNMRFGQDMEAAGGGYKNPVFSALQMYQRPTVQGSGSWLDPVHGLQENPAFLDRPQVFRKPEMVTNEKTGKTTQGGSAMFPPGKDAMKIAGRLFGIENVQHGVGANMFIPGSKSHKPSQLNGIWFGPKDRAMATQQALKDGLDVLDNGDGGIVITSFGDDPVGKVKAFSSKMPEGTIGRFDNNLVESGLSRWDQTAGSIDPKTGKPGGAYVAIPQGTGQATRELLDATGSIPGLEKRLENSAYPQSVAGRNAVREKYAHELATSLRPDVQKLRDLLAGGGPANVRRWTDIHGFKGLPAWTAILLGGGAAVNSLYEEPASPQAL